MTSICISIWPILPAKTAFSMSLWPASGLAIAYSRQRSRIRRATPSAMAPIRIRLELRPTSMIFKPGPSSTFALGTAQSVNSTW